MKLNEQMTEHSSRHDMTNCFTVGYI